MEGIDAREAQRDKGFGCCVRSFRDFTSGKSNDLYTAGSKPRLSFLVVPSAIAHVMRNPIDFDGDQRL